MTDFSNADFSNGTHEFETEELDIEYRIINANDFENETGLDTEMFFDDFYRSATDLAEENEEDLEDILNKYNVCYIERIDVYEEIRGKGYGSTFLKDFIQELKEKHNINLIALTASYDIDEDCDEYDAKGLHKLVSFYSKLNINSIYGGICANSDLIDMSIDFKIEAE